MNDAIPDALPCRALSLSPAGQPLLLQLHQAGLAQDIASPEETGGAFLTRHWASSQAFVAVGACGAITQLIAPLLQGKGQDPAVVVVDPAGRFAIPLLGGHGAGAERLSQQVAALLGGQAVLTGASSGSGRLALDCFGTAWGWRRGSGEWDGLMQAAARGQQPVVQQTSGSPLWRELEAAQQLSSASDGAAPLLVISDQPGTGCRWHPPSLWVGVGCERGSSVTLLERAVLGALQAAGLAPEAVAGLCSADRKGDEPALLALAAEHQWPLRLFSAAQLAVVPVPTPSAAVEREMGTASVAEAAALLAAGPGGCLRQAKRIERCRSGESGAATAAVAAAAEQWAPQRGQLHLIGSGPGELALLTPDARAALAISTVWVGHGLYLDLLEPLRRSDQLRCDGQLTLERERCRQALELAAQGLTVALVSSGDSGIYGMAGLALELWLALPADARPGFTVHPGISALQLAAARAGAPLMHDFCTISLSDRLTPWETIETRLRGAAAGDFVVALYNPRSRGRDWQLARACALLLEQRSGDTPVALARQLGRPDEQVSLHRLSNLPVAEVDMLTLVLIGNSTTRIQDGRMVTPRGYPGADLA